MSDLYTIDSPFPLHVTQSMDQINKLKQDLKKYKSRYEHLRDMAPEDFGNLSTINEDFDSQVDELIKDRSK